MTLKQRICGFMGHKSIAYTATSVRKGVTHSQLVCTKCGFKTKWFDLVNDSEITDNFEEGRDIWVGETAERCETNTNRKWGLKCLN